MTFDELSKILFKGFKSMQIRIDTSVINVIMTLIEKVEKDIVNYFDN